MREHGPADLVVANNVFAHVPDLNDFTAGHRDPARARRACATIEFPHLVRLVEGNQFDTIYHEHFSYFTLHTVVAVARRARPARLRRRGAADARRVAARVRSRTTTTRRPITPARARLLARERDGGYTSRRGLRGLRGAGRERQARPAGVPDRVPARRRRRSPATARRARATRCSTTAGSGPTSSTTRSTATRTSTAGSRRARTSRSTARGGSPRRGPTSSSSCPGTCGRRSPPSSRTPASGARGWSSRSRRRT